MIFNPDLTKQPQEVIFSRKTVKPFHPQSPVKRSVSQEHLGLHLDQKFDFNTLMKKSQKHKKEYQSLKNFIIFFQEMRC